LLRRRPLLLGAGAAAVALVIVVLFLLLRDGEPPNPFLSIRGKIESPGAQDTYTFTGRKDQQVFLDARECASGGLLVWTLRGPDEESVFSDENLCSSNVASGQKVTLPQAGTYRLTVSGRDDATGTYRVTLWSVPAAQQFSLSIGDTIAADERKRGAEGKRVDFGGPARVR